jgi:hypothetical protein
MSIGITTAGLLASAPFIGMGAKAATGLGSAKMQSGAAGRGAQLQTHAAMRAAELQRQSNMDQLDYLRNQDRIDRQYKQYQDEQNYGLSKDEMMNASAQYNDTGLNRRNELVARNLTDDRLYGENQKQFNTMRQMMGMPNKAESINVSPDPWVYNKPFLTDYKPDPTDYSDQNDRNKNRLV